MCQRGYVSKSKPVKGNVSVILCIISLDYLYNYISVFFTYSLFVDLGSGTQHTRTQFIYTSQTAILFSVFTLVKDLRNQDNLLAIISTVKLELIFKFTFVIAYVEQGYTFVIYIFTYNSSFLVE